jgi:HAMP domain-containing protein
LRRASGVAAAPLTEREYAVRFLAALIATSAGASLVLFAILYLLLGRPLAGGYAAVFYALRDLASYLAPAIAVSVVVYILAGSAAVSIFCILMSHKVAGPLYRMERIFEAYRSGNLIRTVAFRHTDQIEPLAHAFNAWIGNLRRERQRWLAAMDEAERHCLQDERTCREHMRNTLREIGEELARYR